MEKIKFQGDKKEEHFSILWKAEQRFIKKFVHRFPKWIHGYHLTFLSLVWSAGIVVSGYLAKDNIHFLWGVSVLIILHWFTDSFDGALGKFRDFGIPRWGYYADHFFDYLFLSALIIGYTFIFPPESHIQLFLVWTVATASFVSFILEFGATGVLRIQHFFFSPTEGRLFFIIANIFLIFFGIPMFLKMLPFIIAGLVFMLVVLFVKTSRRIYSQDKNEKSSR